MIRKDTLYISDLDGTLLGKDARLSEKTAAIINRLIDEGLLFTVATARSLSSVSILEKLRIRIPCVQLNGVLMYDFPKGQYTGCTPIDTESARRVIDVLRKHDRMSFVYKADSTYGIHVEFEKLTNDVERNFFEVRKDNDYKSFSRTEHITVSDDDKVIYFTMVDKYSRLSGICEELKLIPGVRPTLYSDNYSDLYFLEVFSSRATKALGMMRIKELTGAKRVVAFGDNLNDMEMLADADVGIAVGDAAAQVRESADIVIGNSYEDAVALWLEKECRGSDVQKLVSC